MAHNADVLGYLPPVLRNFYELQAVAAAENSGLNALWAAADDLLKAPFVELAEEGGIARFEQLLSLTPAPSDSLAERRFRVRSILSGRLPFTLRALRQQLALLCGEDGFALRLQDNTLVVEVALTAQSELQAVKDLLTAMAPANLLLQVSVQYRRHSELTGCSHADLHFYTHIHIREGGEIS